jgi:hypothetical protein
MNAGIILECVVMARVTIMLEDTHASVIQDLSCQVVKYVKMLMNVVLIIICVGMVAAGIHLAALSVNVLMVFNCQLMRELVRIRMNVKIKIIAHHLDNVII